VKFRKKPIVIEAIQVTQKMRFEGGPYPEWALPHLRMTWSDKADRFESVGVTTLEGFMTVCDGDWLIQGVKGEVYPCKPDIFEATYDEVRP